MYALQQPGAGLYAGNDMRGLATRRSLLGTSRQAEAYSTWSSIYDESNSFTALPLD